MDYGPFGWIDKYDPLFAKWVGSGEHFAFMNQPNAAGVNLKQFLNHHSSPNRFFLELLGSLLRRRGGVLARFGGQLGRLLAS